MVSRLEGKVAVITGAAMGMGAGAARRFVTEGARVVLADIDLPAASALAKELGDNAVAVGHDVSDERSWETVVGTAEATFGGIDILLNNAGIWRTAPLVEQSAEGFDRIIAVNLRGVFLGMRAVATPMRARGGGSIVNTSSTAGLVGLANMVAYGASKWGVRGVTKVAAVELGPWGIRVNSIHPGGVDTPMTASLRFGRSDGVATHPPIGRHGTPSDIADLHVFLASDESSWITGSEIYIDGGLMAGPPPPN
ncbi:SDR family NAD(P)-dependent oxidoreductase [Actinoplanes sp. CA-142083]|uniref:SDR family NAD(P)-dependent oxidoreductase n=1 Tax=Actinoplanes sp. CA-142083 TaxID=3239903 RepID=UPI003D924369